MSFFTIMKKCLFVGSFNPITKSHQEIAVDLLNHKIVDYIYFLPVNSKKNNLVSISNRINMINLVINNYMETLNIYNYQENGLFNYLVLEKLKDLKITHLVMGSDLFFKFYTFKNYKNILEKYNLIIIERNNDDIESLIINKYFKYQDKFIIIKKKYFGSSSIVRDNLNKDKVKYLDKKVLAYIKKFNLYN